MPRLVKESATAKAAVRVIDVIGSLPVLALADAAPAPGRDAGLADAAGHSYCERFALASAYRSGPGSPRRRQDESDRPFRRHPSRSGIFLRSEEHTSELPSLMRL